MSSTTTIKGRTPPQAFPTCLVSGNSDLDEPAPVHVRLGYLRNTYRTSCGSPTSARAASRVRLSRLDVPTFHLRLRRPKDSTSVPWKVGGNAFRPRCSPGRQSFVLARSGHIAGVDQARPVRRTRAFRIRRNGRQTPAPAWNAGTSVLRPPRGPEHPGAGGPPLRTYSTLLPAPPPPPKLRRANQPPPARGLSCSMRSVRPAAMCCSR